MKAMLFAIGLFCMDELSVTQENRFVKNAA
jgi:coenzyme F420-reducing hydrogenase beta subunit